jgi:hypothetical protein
MIPLARHALALATVAGAFAAVLAAAPKDAAAQYIRQEGRHEPYNVELEPHVVFGWSNPPGVGTGDGFGLGLRGTFEIVEHGFIKKLNDSIGIGVGLDWVHYDGDGVGPRGECLQTRTIRGGIPVCIQASGSGDDDTEYLWVPIVMQWNFWLHKRWSVFGEPGLAMRFDDFNDLGISPFVLFFGGRFHLSYNATLTLRLSIPHAPIGPYASFGASFLF